MSRSIDRVAPLLRSTMRDLAAGKRPWPLYIHGPAGTGKTSAALALLDYCGPGPRPDLADAAERLRNWVAGYADVRSLTGLKIDADKGRLQWPGGGLATWDHLLGSVGRAPLFVFDEIGVGANATDFRLDSLLEVIDRRAGNPVRPFVVTGNLTPSELLQVYDDRIADRILSGSIHNLDGASRRTQR